MTDPRKTANTHRAASPIRFKLAVLVLVVGMGLTVAWFARDYLSLDALASQEAELRTWKEHWPWLMALLAIAIYAAMAGLSIPGAVVLTLIYGWYFGFVAGLVVVSFGSTAGATLAFLLSRYLFRDWVQSRWQERLQSIREAFDREGPYYLFTLRLVPAVPFFVINVVMGLTEIRTRTFWWVSQLGMLPGTAAYVYAGSTVPSLTLLAEEGVGQVLSWQLIVAFALLGILPLVAKRMLARWSPASRDPQSMST